MSTKPELYVSLEIGSEGGPAKSVLETAMECGPIASLLIRPRSGASLDASVAKDLVAVAQKRGVAALIADDANLARLLRADGVHLPWSKDIVQRSKDAREILGERYSIGADAGRSRDDAMSLGELGADYVAFGIPPHVEDRATAEHRQRDLISWWSKIFQISCVAFDIATPGHAKDLADDGADFICVELASTMPPPEARDWITAFASAVQRVGTPA